MTKETPIRPWIMALVLLAIVILFYWRLTLTQQYNWISSPDIATQVIPWFEVQARQWHQGKFPLWDPHLWMGQPLLGQAQPGVAYPLNWLLFWLPLRDGLIRTNFLKWYFIAIHFMAAGFAYWLCRDLNRSRTASLIGACLFSFGAYMGSIDWPQMVNGAVWTPVVLLFLLRAVRGYRPWFSAAASGAALGMAWLSGHHQIPIFASILAAILWVCFARRDRRILQFGAICFVFSFFVGGLQIVPAMAYGRDAVRWVGAVDPITWNQPVPYSVHETFALPGRAIIGMLLPDFRANVDSFVGVVSAALALIALALAWGDSRVRLFSAIALGSLLFSLGPLTPLHGLIYSLVPLAEKARSPGMAILFVQLGVTVLAAFGADAWASGEPSYWRRRVVLGTAFFSGFIYAVFLVVALVQRTLDTSDDRVFVLAFYSLLLSALLAAWKAGRIGPRAAGVLLLLLVIADLANNVSHRFPPNDSPQASRFLSKAGGNKDIAIYLRNLPGPVRIEEGDDEVIGNFGDWYGIDSVDGYLASLTSNYNRLDHSNPRFRMVLGVTHTLSKKPTRPNQQEVFRGKSGVLVYRNPDAFPRVWTVHQTASTLGGDADHVNYYFQKDGFDLRHAAPMADPLPALANCPAESDDASLALHEADRVTIDAAMACDGLVVLSDTFAPGWKATVDGAPAPIVQVYGALRAVAVKQGRHLIEMRYRPVSVLIGAILSSLGLTGLGLISILNPAQLTGAYTRFPQDSP